MLGAGERAPTPSPSSFVVFTFGLAIESIKEFGGASRMAFQIVDYILKTLHPCPSLKSMKEVMEKVMSHPRLNHSLLDKVLPTHLAIAQHEVLVGLNMSIDANKMV